MNRFNLEWAIAAWRRQYDTRRTFGRKDLDELERHLRDQTTWFLDQGIDEEVAFRRAVKELGSVFEAEEEYRKVFWKKLRHRKEARGELRWRLAMFGRYIKSGLRSLRRQKMVSFINIFGLSIALASAVCTYIFLDSYLGMDDFHEKGERVFLVHHAVQQDGEVQYWGRNPMALGPALTEQMTGVEHIVRSRWQGGRLFADGVIHESTVLFVDPAYLDVLTFPVAEGAPNPLRDSGGIAITSPAAERYFGDGDPIGQTVSFTVGGRDRFEFTIRSILEPLPGASGTRFEILAPFDMLSAARGYDDDDWSQRLSGTMMLLQPGVEPDIVEARLNGFIERQHIADPDWPIQSFFLDNLKNPSENAYLVNGRPMEVPHPVFVIMLILIPAAMLMLSVFNYVNIAIGSAERRLKEIGIRKVVGGQRRQLIAQFLVENLVLCTISLIIAGLISWAFLLPVFDQIFVYALTWAPISGFAFWAAMIGLLLGTAAISGAYPALYVSSFRPVAVFRGTLELPGRKVLSHAFMTMQFVVAFVCILLGLYMAFGNDFTARDDWGYDPEPVVSVSVSSEQQLRVLEARLEGRSNIRSISSARDHIGFSQPGALLTIGDESHRVRHMQVGAGYLATLGLPVLRGRGFPEEYGADTGRIAVITERMAAQLGWSDPLNETFVVNEAEYVIVGVAADPVLHPVLRYEPLFFSRMSDDEATRAIVAGQGLTEDRLLESVRSEWEILFPDVPFDGLAQTSIFDLHIESWTNLTNAMIMMGMLALIISCMGLFGLASQGVSARMKEISIRKVLGANAAWVALRVHARYLILITVGAAIAMPLVYFGITTPLRIFEIDYITVGPGVFVTSYALVMAMALISIMKHAFVLASVNPANTLRGD